MRTAIYLRISSEDADLRTGEKDESESISNQRSLLREYVSSHAELSDSEILEFCDDGWSGTNFERPAVKELLEQVRRGQINCILVKDLSRFGRDYLTVGDYISRVFPFLGVRFISVNDGLDSSNPLDIDPDYSIDSLTETGWIEAELLSDRLCKLDVKAFYCSPKGRARDTAKATLEKLGRQAEILPWLREFSPQVLRPGKDKPGVAWDWLPQDWTKDKGFYDREHWWENDRFTAAGVREEAQWVWDGLDELLARHGYRREGGYYRAEQSNEDTVVLFCHFGVTCVLLSHLLGISPMPLWQGTCSLPTSVTILNTEERREGIASFRMTAFGDTSHLYAAGREPSFSGRFCETYGNWEQRHD